jgi:hypothetical protein
MLLSGKQRVGVTLYATKLLTRYNDALIHYKSLPDPVWHAATIEALCTVAVLEAWAGSAGLVRQSTDRQEK